MYVASQRKVTAKSTINLYVFNVCVKGFVQKSTSKLGKVSDQIYWVRNTVLYTMNLSPIVFQIHQRVV